MKVIIWGLTVKNFRKCLKTLLNGCFLNQFSKEFVCGFFLKNGIKKNCLWWCIVVSCINHASGKVLPRLVECYQEIFYASCFSNTSRWLLLKLPRNNQLFLIQSKVSEHQWISFYGIFSNFIYITTAFSPHFISPLQSSFFMAEMKMLFNVC